MANHTPGPWWWGGPEWPNCVFSQERHATPMVECNYMDGDAEDIANAQLIAAAPETARERDDLLAALEQISTVVMEPFNGSNNFSSMKLTAIDELARKAIAKGGE